MSTFGNLSGSKGYLELASEQAADIRRLLEDLDDEGLPHSGCQRLLDALASGYLYAGLSGDTQASMSVRRELAAAATSFSHACLRRMSAAAFKRRGR